MPSTTVDESEQTGAAVQTTSENATDYSPVKSPISADKSTIQTDINNPDVLNATPRQEEGYGSPQADDTLAHHLEDSSSLPNAKKTIDANVMDSNFLSELPEKEDLSDTKPPSEMPTVTDATDPSSSKVNDAGDPGLLPGSPRAKNAAPDPKIARGSPKAKDAADPSFLGEFFQNSRLHHISTMGANAKVNMWTLSPVNLNRRTVVSISKLYEQLRYRSQEMNIFYAVGGEN